MSWKTTGAAIKAKRLELGLTLGAACRCCGISYEAWEDTEKGKRTLPEEDLERIGKRLGMDPFADGLIGDVFYMQVTRDALSLPLAVAESPRELAELLGVQVGSIHDSIYRGKKRKYPGYIKVQKEQDNGEENET